ncbi:MAG: dockerin type I repeat-containing protein [Bacteroidaceae bacterium]|nr:dockerin type I repeat-containing protein [Bacteroidaceae bacterium]
MPLGRNKIYAVANTWSKFYDIQEWDKSINPISSIGDANNDGKVDVSDITATASYILGVIPVEFNFEAADANEDGTVDVADITATASIILTGKAKEEEELEE